MRLAVAFVSPETAPLRGTRRDELRAGLRTFGVERQATIPFTVDEDRGEAIILGVFYGGRDIDAFARERGIGTPTNTYRARLPPVARSV